MLINPEKSVVINICKDTLISENLITIGAEIQCITPEDKI